MRLKKVSEKRPEASQMEVTANHPVKNSNNSKGGASAKRIYLLYPSEKLQIPV